MSRKLALVALALCLLLGGGYVAYSRLQVAAPRAQAVPKGDVPAPLPVVADAQTESQAVVTAVVGRVEKQVGSGWSELHVGDMLTVRDTIRTAEGARATLDAGVVVQVEDRTELTVGEITASLSQLALNEGRITANAAGGGRTVRISTRNSDAVAETAAGSIDVLSRNGAMTVAARDGNAKLTAQQKTVHVGAGQLSTVTPGAAPSAPSAIPPSLFLKVAANHKAGVSDVTGEASPGAVVTINGVAAGVTDADGKFAAEVPVAKADTKIVVQVEDVLGRRERKVIARSAVTPKLETKVEWQ